MTILVAKKVFDEGDLVRGYLVVLVPAEILGVEVVVAVEQVEVVGQVARRGEVAGVDEGAGRRVGQVVGAAVDHRHDAVLQRRVELVGDVVAAQRVLEGQHELVVGAQHLQTLVGAAAVQVAAAAVNVHLVHPKTAVTIARRQYKDPLIVDQSRKTHKDPRLQTHLKSKLG